MNIDFGKLTIVRNFCKEIRDRHNLIAEVSIKFWSYEFAEQEQIRFQLWIGSEISRMAWANTLDELIAKIPELRELCEKHFNKQLEM